MEILDEAANGQEEKRFAFHPTSETDCVNHIFQVDLEVNGEQVEIQMKLDDNGAAFFVEDVEEDEEWSPELATSPIPDQSHWSWQVRHVEINKKDKMYIHFSNNNLLLIFSKNEEVTLTL